MSAKVSAIVSAYYAEEYLTGRIEDLLDQSEKPEVVIVCRNGSEEMKIAEWYQNAVPSKGQIAIVTTSDIPTVYEAWNKGIEAATGEYLTNANSDDRLYKDALHILYRTLKSNPDHAVAYFDIDRVKEINGEPLAQFIWAEGGLDVLLQGCFLGPMPMWRKSLHEKYGMFDGSLTSAGDYEFWLRLAAEGEKFKHVHNVLGAHLEKKSALEHRSPVRTIWETARVRALYRQEIP